MLRTLMTCLLAGAAALAQAQAKNAQKQPAQPPAAQSKPTPPSLLKPSEAIAPVAPNQPVLTIQGVCPSADKRAIPAAQDCKTTLTKEQFDNLINAFNAGNQPVTPAMRRQIGQAYVEILTVSEAAREAGVENSPAFIEVMRVIRMKTLSDFYRTQLNEQFRKPSPQEIEEYYKSNAARYEGAKLNRIYVPRNSPDPQASPAQKEDFQKKAQQVADDIQARAAKGEEMDKLQKEAYTTLGIGVPPPTTDLHTARHGVFPAKLDQEIFSHKAGEVFRADDGNGFMIYRVENREPVPLESVQEEIVREIARHKLEEKMKQLNAPVHADFNDSYFGPAQAPPTPSRLPVPNPSR